MKSSKEILEILESKADEFNGYGVDAGEFNTCYLDELEDENIEYLKDSGSVFIKTSDGVLVIPWGPIYCNDSADYYKVLNLDYAYLAYEKVDLILNKVEYYKKLISLLETK